MENKNIYQKLTELQTELKAPKNQYNSFGGYKYRSAEDILEAVKPLLKKHNLTQYISDEVININEARYIKSSIKLINQNNIQEVIEVSALAREADSKKGMDTSQITGSTSSYARKYALNGLYLIDDTKDQDTNEYKKEQEQRKKQTQKNNKNNNEFITKSQLKKIKNMYYAEVITAKDLNTLLKKYNAKKVEELTNENAEKIIDFIKGGSND